ncbi:MAG: patatin family protein [Gammaproteobacteria bacterium]|nr:patatin family protein [Gammaproteobacteria bacterium]
MNNDIDKLHTALIVEGGALRGIFSAGVLDTFIANDFYPFDSYFGVSSGSGVVASYLSGKSGRMSSVFRDYTQRPESISIKRFLRGGHLMDLDWLWDITLRELPLDYEAILNRKSQFLIGLTSVQTGQAVYIQPTRENFDELVKASCAIPIIYRNFPLIDNQPMADGGVADSIPVQAAIDQGARRIMVIRSRHKRYRKIWNPLESLVIGYFMKRTPALKEKLAQRTQHYNDTLALIRNPPSGVEIIEICPPNTFKANRLGRSADRLKQGYEMGLNAGHAAMKKWGK